MIYEWLPYRALTPIYRHPNRLSQMNASHLLPGIAPVLGLHSNEREWETIIWVGYIMETGDPNSVGVRDSLERLQSFGHIDGKDVRVRCYHNIIVLDQTRLMNKCPCQLRSPYASSICMGGKVGQNDYPRHTTCCLDLPASVVQFLFMSF